jgi:hypothetical protein
MNILMNFLLKQVNLHANFRLYRRCAAVIEILIEAESSFIKYSIKTKIEFH